MPALLTMSALSAATDAHAGAGGDAPSGVISAAWVMLLVPCAMVVVGVLYGLLKYGEGIGDGANADSPSGSPRGARGWSGPATAGDGTEMPLLEQKADDSFGDGDSDATAVEGWTREPAEQQQQQQRLEGAPRWKLRREGFSTTLTSSPSNFHGHAPTGSIGRGRGRGNPRVSRAVNGMGVSVLPPTSSKDD